MDERTRRELGKLYCVYDVPGNEWIKARSLLQKINSTYVPDEARAYFDELLGAFPKSSHITPPFYCDLGTRIFLGQSVHINMDCLFLDEGKITIGDRVLIGPRCSFYTPIHPMDPQVRATGLETCKPIHIENDVWLGGSVTVNGGVTIGEGSVIGSGSVVVRDIPDYVFACGNPCRVVRPIDQQDQKEWNDAWQDYLRDPDTAGMPESHE